MKNGYIFLKTIQYLSVLTTCYLALEYESIWTGILCFLLAEYKLQEHFTNIKEK